MTYRQRASIRRNQSIFISVEILLVKQETFATQIRLIDKKLKEICCVDCAVRFKIKRKIAVEQFQQVTSRMSRLITKLNQSTGCFN